jgi:hypothetical protein
LVDVTGHRVALRTGVVAAMVAALLTALPAPVAAQNPDLRLGGVGNIELRVGGGSQSVQIQVQNRANDPAGNADNVQLTMTVPLADFAVHIASAPPECTLANRSRMDCVIPQIPPGGTWNGLAQVAVDGNSPLQAGETRNGTAQVLLSSGGGQQQFNVRLQGPERPPGVPEVSGSVTNEATGEPIEGATVLLVDSQGAEFRATTNANGEYRFTGENIAPGGLGLRASKDGFEGQENIQQGQEGQPLTGVRLTLRSTASPTPGASPSASPTPTASGVPSPVAVADTGGSSGSFFTTLLVILGVLFVLLGIGAIVFLIIRRRREQQEGEGPDGSEAPTSGPRGPGPRPGSHGVYRPGPAAATQVIGARGGPLPAVGPSPALADAPTMMQQRAGGADQTTLLPRAGDPSPTSPTRPIGPRPPVAGGPPPPRPAAPTYGTPSPGYEDPRARPPGGGAYGSPAGYGGPAHGSPAHGSPAPASPGYGSPAYGPADRTEPAGYPAEPATGRHGRGGYGSVPDGGSYGPDPYTQPSRPTAGYPPPGYDQPGRRDAQSRGDGYGGGPGPSGYDRSGYGRSGHDQPGYDQPGYDQPGYDQPGHHQPGYDQSGYAAPAARDPGYSAPAARDPGYSAPAARDPGYRQQPGYGQPDAGPPAPEQPDYPDYYDESGRPRSRHSAAEPPERRRLDWLDD